MPLPHVVARFNKRVTNRFLEPIARRSPGFAVVHHTGRRSGASYATPLNLFGLGDGVDQDEGVDRGGDAIVSLTYGPSADWVQNVLAGSGAVEDRSGRRSSSPRRVVGRDVAWPVLPRLVRGALRMLRVRDFLLLSITDAD